MTLASAASALTLAVALASTLGLGGACSRRPEDTAKPVSGEQKGSEDVPPPPTGSTAPMKPTPTADLAACPVDPEPSKNASLYGHGAGTFVTPDGVSHAFQLEIAATDDSQERGLMYRTSLAEDAGMVFVFDQPHHAVFWMKNTCIPLDMVFVGENEQVIGVVTAPPLNTEPRQVGGFSKYVVELAAGVAQKLGIGIGTKFVPPKTP
jgi:uncharacterized membrane protein (UPF0127 family)